MAHPNADLLKKAYDAFAAGDLNALPFADSITFHIPGGNPLSGTYKGKQEVFGFLQKVMERSAGTFRLEVHGIVADDEHAIGLTKHSGQHAGKSADYNSVHVFEVKGGLLAEFWEFPDQPQFDNFWS
jgi:ketosteroid isomerase-like protein